MNIKIHMGLLFTFLFISCTRGHSISHTNIHSGMTHDSDISNVDGQKNSFFPVGNRLPDGNRWNYIEYKLQYPDEKIISFTNNDFQRSDDISRLPAPKFSDFSVSKTYPNNVSKSSDFKIFWILLIIFVCIVGVSLIISISFGIYFRKRHLQGIETRKNLYGGQPADVYVI